MKKGKADALRWLRQAEHDLAVAEHNHTAGFYSDVCFMCEQASQKALKAYLIFKTGRPPLGEHSIQVLARRCAEFDKKFGELARLGGVLDRYYIPTRYPDALAPPVAPYEAYLPEDAENALHIAKRIFQLVKNEMEGGE